MSNPITPSVGRIVLFTPTNGLAPKGQPYPAVITHVHDNESVNLCILNDGSFPLSDPSPAVRLVSVGYDQNGGDFTWRWMDYQLGQAERTRQAEAKVQEQSS